MATNCYMLETLHARYSGAIETSNGTIARTTVDDLVDSGTDTDSAYPLSQGIIPFGCETSTEGFGVSTVIRGVSISGSIDGTTDAQIYGFAGDAFVYLNGLLVANTGSTLFRQSGNDSLLGGCGRSNPQQHLQFDGAALTAVQALAGTPALDAVVTYRQSAWMSPVGLTYFGDSADEDDVSNLVLRALQGSGNGITLPNGQRMVGCAYAAIGPEGTVWIDPSDLGDTIPTSVANNTADRFRQHPTVFYTVKGVSTIQGTSVRAFGGPISQTLARQPIGISVLTDETLYSTWLFVIDGNPIVARISHNGADLRRPRDIWSDIIAPAVARSSGNNNRLTTYAGIEPVGTIGRLGYLDYARFLGPIGSTLQTEITPAG